MKKRMFRVLAVVAFVLGCCVWAQEPPAPQAPQGKPNGRPGVPPPEMQQRAMPAGMGSRADDVVIIMNRLKKENPEEYARLDQLRQTNHGQFFAEIRKLLPRETNAIQTMMENERVCRQLAQKIRACQNEEEKAKLEAELKEKIVSNFDATIAEATARIEKLQARIAAYKENRDDILEARYQAFIRMARAPRERPNRPGKPGPRPENAETTGEQLPPPPPPPAPQAE